MTSGINLIKVNKGYSLFSIVSKYCQDEAEGRSYNSAVHRLCSLMRKMDVKTTVSEVISPLDDEISTECNALYTYFGTKIDINAYRLTFLSEGIKSLEEIQELKDDCFLSSAIVINFNNPGPKRGGWRSYLYSAIVVTPSIRNHKRYGTLPLLNNYLHISKTFKCKMRISNDSTHSFSITGTFFCQQNSETSVCANASLCMVINNMDLPKISMVTPEEINKKVGIDHSTVKFGTEKPGLSNEEINKVLAEYKLSYTLLDFFENPNREYNEWIYNYIESRHPVLLIFTVDTTISHIIPIFGHTLNSDTWRPEAESAYSPARWMNRLDLMKSSAAWVDHFIIHDDNFGMYFCLPVDALKRITLPKHDPSFRAVYAIAIIPKGIKTPSWEAEWASIIDTNSILEWRAKTGMPLDIWTDRFIKRIQYRKSIVTRTFLTTKSDYKKSLNQKDFDGNAFSEIDKKELIRNLPNRFWLTEITLPDLYTANKSKIIDFFYPCNLKEHKEDKEILKRWLQIRFPYVLIKKGKDNRPTPFLMSVKSHYPLLGFDETGLHW